MMEKSPIKRLLRAPAIKSTVILHPKGKIALRSSHKEEALALARREAYQKGKEEGEKIGYDRAMLEQEFLMVLLQKVTHKFIEQKSRFLEALKPEIIEFSLSVCEKVIRQELLQPDKLAKMIDSLLAAATPFLQGELVKIILSPDDLVSLEKYIGKIQYDQKEIKGVRFAPDPQVKRGDCRIETKQALLNCTISRELEDLKTKVLLHS